MTLNRRDAMISMGRFLVLGSAVTGSGLVAACSNKKPYEMKSDEERREEEAQQFADVARKRNEELKKAQQSGGGEGGGHSH